VGAAFGGWQVSTVVRLSSGTPFTLIDSGSVDFDFDGVNVSRPVVVDPHYRGGLHINYPPNSQAKLPASAFRHAVYGDTLHDLIGRNTFYTDGPENVDMGLYKSFHLPMGRYSLMVRLDAFNVFNHPTYSFPNNDINSVNFGKITATNNFTPRTLQFGFRFLY
jgi:hypothetical protein